MLCKSHVKKNGISIHFELFFSRRAVFQHIFVIFKFLTTGISLTTQSEFAVANEENKNVNFGQRQSRK